jgi:hypothetical protein
MSNINTKEIKSFCHTVFADNLRKTQRENMGRSVGALIAGRDARLSSVARHFEGADTFKYRLKRFDRFIGNERIKTWECFAVLVPVILKLADRMNGYLPVLLDHTDVGQDLRVCYAAVLFKRRALPLIFFVFNKRKVRKSQNKIEEHLLRRLHGMIPSRLRVVVVADRGFGRVSLFRFLKGLKWHFVIRVKGKVCIKHAQEGVLNTLPAAWWRKDVSYHKQARYTLNLLSLTAGTNDPWYLATDLDDPALVKSIYEKRMRIEELFRDQKWHVGMVVPTTRNVGRFSRLLFIVLLVSLLLIMLGRQVQKYPALVKTIIADPAKAGLLWLAGQALEHAPPKQVQILMRRVVRSLVLAG